MTTKTRLRSPIAIAALAPPPEGKRRVRYSDSPNLAIEIERLPSGALSRYWRYDYVRPRGGRSQLSLGVFPKLGAKQAREKAAAFNELVGQGIDPKFHRASADALQAKEQTSIAQVGRLWLAKQQENDRLRKSTLARYEGTQRAIERASIGKLPIGSLSTDVEQFQAWLSELKAKGCSAAYVKTLCKHAARIFSFAIVRRYCTGNPAHETLQARELPSHRQKHFAAVTDPIEAGSLLRAIRGDTSEIGRMATEFLALTFVRPHNVWRAKWADIDMSRAIWTIPAEGMKTNRPHLVPLSRQALAILRAMKQINGIEPYVFGVGKPLSIQTFKLLSQRIGWDGRHTAHGFRAMASTILNGDSEHAFRRGYKDVIEMQLSHSDKDKIAAAYNRNDMWPSRVELMQHWADALDRMAAPLRVVNAA